MPNEEFLSTSAFDHLTLQIINILNTITKEMQGMALGLWKLKVKTGAHFRI